MEPVDEIKSELDSFREQWRAEVRARQPGAASSSQSSTAQTHQQSEHHVGAEGSAASARTAVLPRRSGPPPSRAVPKAAAGLDDEYGEGIGRPFEDLSISESKDKGPEAPRTALEHYERAVEKESQGNLGESLNLYRQAFRVRSDGTCICARRPWPTNTCPQMDSLVDQQYKNKHYPPQAKPPAASKVTGAARQSRDGAVTAGGAQPPSPSAPLTAAELIASYAHTSIRGAPAAVEGDPPPPCPIATVPEEIICQVLIEVAIRDVGSLTRLALVCRRMAYLVATEERIWRRVCLGSEFGFRGMHRRWQRAVEWGPLLSGDSPVPSPETAVFPAATSSKTSSATDDSAKRPDPILETCLALLPRAPYNNSWRQLFRYRPRVRFNGVYISTVNYVRAGQAAVHERNFTSHSPLHVVTYYRYLRLFRDGTCVSLLTTHEPAEVVPHLTRDAVMGHVLAHAASATNAGPGGSRRHHLLRHQQLHHGTDPTAAGDAALATAAAAQQLHPTVRDALRGRWRLGDTSGAGRRRDLADVMGGGAAAEDETELEQEGDLFVETEGVPTSMTAGWVTTTTGAAGGSGGGGSSVSAIASVAGLDGVSSISAIPPARGKYMYRMDLALRSSGRGTGPRNTKLVWRGFYSYNRLTDDWAEFGLRNDKPFFFSRVKSYGNGE